MTDGETCPPANAAGTARICGAGCAACATRRTSSHPPAAAPGSVAAVHGPARALANGPARLARLQSPALTRQLRARDRGQSAHEGGYTVGGSRLSVLAASGASLPAVMHLCRRGGLLARLLFPRYNRTRTSHHHQLAVWLSSARRHSGHQQCARARNDRSRPSRLRAPRPRRAQVDVVRRTSNI
jgi:hypothetical protein